MINEISFDEIYKRRNIFYQKYPNLFPKGDPICGFDCDIGWFDILDDLCDKINQCDISKDEDFCVDQIKEKFGSLRFYVSKSNDTVNELIKIAENQTCKTCECCGKPGKLRRKGWAKTRCDDCQSQYEKEINNMKKK